MATKEIKINQFFGGELENERTESINSAAFIENFDIGQNPEYLLPTQSMTKNGSSYNTDYGIRKVVATGFQSAFNVTSSAVWGYGQVASNNVTPRIFKLSNPLDSATSTWSAPINSQRTGGTPDYGLFSFYHDYIYLVGQSNTTIDRYGPISGSYSYTSAWYTPASNFDVTCDGIQGKDDNLYFGYQLSDRSASGLVRINGSTATIGCINIPTTHIVKQCAIYGNYLAMILCPITNGFNSYLWLWDYASTNPSEIVDLGSGFALGGDNVEGRLLILVSNRGNSTATIGKPFISLIEYSGGAPTVIKRIPGYFNLANSGGVVNINVTTQAFNYRGHLYFGISYTKPNDTNSGNHGLMRIGRKNINYPISFSHDYGIVDGNISIGGSNGVNDFLFYDENLLAIVGGATQDVYITNNPVAYNTATYTSEIFKGDFKSKIKNLLGVSVDFNPLSSGATVSLSYKIDGQTSFTQIFSESTSGTISHESVVIESTGATLPNFKEIQFQIISTGGAQLTGFMFKFDEQDNLIG